MYAMNEKIYIMFGNENSYSGVLDGVEEVGGNRGGEEGGDCPLPLHPTSATNQLIITQSLLCSFQMTKFR